MNKRTTIELFLLSAVSLYLELLVIRWMSADIRAFTVFRTFPLVTCFVGLGVGFAMGKDMTFRLAPWALLLFFGTMVGADWFGIGYLGFPTVSVFQWQNLVPTLNSLGLFMVLLVLLLCGPFALCVGIGSRLGVLFNQLSPLPAYCWNIAGAIAGSIAFALLSYLQWAPWQLALPAQAIMVYYACSPMQRGPLRIALGLAAVAAIPVLCLWPLPPREGGLDAMLDRFQVAPLRQCQVGATQTYWSPYQRIDVRTFRNNKTTGDEFMGLELGVNRAFYQYFLSDSLDPSRVPPQVATLLADRTRQYGLPFKFHQAQDVLVVGAGTGQNVASAIAGGATSIDAVDIDPLILKIGKQYNPLYSSPKVNVICDDARHFFGQTKKNYDLIIFTLLDSHAVTGQGSSVRVDGYVYTKQSIAQAIKLLKPDGVVVISFAAVADWVPGRLFATFREAAGYEPLVLHDDKAVYWGRPDLIFVLGEKVKQGLLAVPEGWTRVKVTVQPGARILTDDWPYLYIRTDVVDMPFYLVIAEVLLIAIFSGRRLLFTAGAPGSWQMFFLGAAFLLLELHAISYLSLVYGSTWLTSAIVINGILLMILMANMFVIKQPWIRDKQPLVYGLLLASILVSYLVPAHQILDSCPGAGGCLLVTVITLAPMCMAGVLFAVAFSQVQNPARALAYNLFGAVVGGLLEYVSNYTGLKALELIALGLYIVSFWCAQNRSGSQSSQPAADASTGGKGQE